MARTDGVYRLGDSRAGTDYENALALGPLLGLIGYPVRIGDIDNAEAFVQRALNKCGMRFSEDEREVLLCEGLAILCELAKVYKPLEARPGVDVQAGRFSGFASMFLPRRLGDAWHKMHPEHRYVTDPETGKRGWRYEQTMLSLDGLSSQDESTYGAEERRYGADHHLLHARTINAFCHTATLSLLSRTTPSPA